MLSVFVRLTGPQHLLRAITKTARRMATLPAFNAPEGDLYRSKPAWRKAVTQHLTLLSGQDVQAQSKSALEQLKTLDCYRNAKRISVFLSMPSGELQTAPIVLDALQSGKQVFVPHITRRPAIMNMLELTDEEDFTSLQPDKWGIPSLEADSISSRRNCFGNLGIDGEVHAGHGLDLILMPAVAFDRDFNRLGHGKGYYDKFLERFDGQSCLRKPYLVGLALSPQFLDDPLRLPTEGWDKQVDAILVGGDLRTRQTAES